MGLRFSVVQPDSPAAAAGLQPGDAILAVDGQQYEFFGEGSVLDDLQANTGSKVVLTVLRANGQTRDDPGHAPDAVRDRRVAKDEQGRPTKGPLGISGGPTGFDPVFYGTYSRDLPSALGIAAQQTTHWFGLILAGLGDLVGGFVKQPDAPPPPVAGPIGIATQIGDIFFNAGPILTLYVAAVLSANLALVNILPFPPLDGGRALMLVLKAVFGERISLRAERLTYVVGFVVLIAFLIWVTGFDIAADPERQPDVTRRPMTSPDRRPAPTDRQRRRRWRPRRQRPPDRRPVDDEHRHGRRRTRPRSRSPGSPTPARELVRVTVNTEEAAAAVPEMMRKLRDLGVDVPVIGDFHYNGHQLLVEYPEMARGAREVPDQPGQRRREAP